MHLTALSNERLDPWINWTTLGPPLLNPLASRSDVTLISPPPLRWANSAELMRLISEVRRTDSLFWMQGTSRPERPLRFLAAAAGGVRRSAFVVDAFKPKLEKIGAIAVAQRLDPCFVAFREGCEELARAFPRGRFEWLPFGIDTEVFDAGDGERDIFAYWMGRRYEPLHEALLRYCAERDLEYRYTIRGGEISDPKELGKLVGRSRYFVVTPPDLDNPARTGGFSPLVMRYMEGLSAGARLLGVLPRSGEYEALLPRDAVLEVEPDGSDLAVKLDADVASNGGKEAVEWARAVVREHHSWARRADQIYDRLTTGCRIEF